MGLLEGRTLPLLRGCVHAAASSLKRLLHPEPRRCPGQSSDSTTRGQRMVGPSCCAVEGHPNVGTFGHVCLTSPANRVVRHGACGATGAQSTRPPQGNRPHFGTLGGKGRREANSRTGSPAFRVRLQTDPLPDAGTIALCPASGVCPPRRAGDGCLAWRHEAGGRPKGGKARSPTWPCGPRRWVECARPG
jgi:hypothetical protein